VYREKEYFIRKESGLGPITGERCFEESKFIYAQFLKENLKSYLP